MVYVDKSGNGGSSPLAENMLVCARQLRKCAFFSSKLSHFRLSICNLLPVTNAIEISDKAGEIFKRNEPFAGKVPPTHLFPNNKYYSLSVSEKAIGGLYWNTKAAMSDG